MEKVRERIGITALLKNIFWTPERDDEEIAAQTLDSAPPEIKKELKNALKKVQAMEEASVAPTKKTRAKNGGKSGLKVEAKQMPTIETKLGKEKPKEIEDDELSL